MLLPNGFNYWDEIPNLAESPSFNLDTSASEGQIFIFEDVISHTMVVNIYI